jgi:hypothetical protein
MLHTYTHVGGAAAATAAAVSVGTNQQVLVLPLPLLGHAGTAAIMTPLLLHLYCCMAKGKGQRYRHVPTSPTGPPARPPHLD